MVVVGGGGVLVTKGRKSAQIQKIPSVGDPS